MLNKCLLLKKTQAKIGIKTSGLIPLFVAMVISTGTPLHSQTTPPLQNSGIPYTKSAREIALKAIKGTTAIFEGSRYAYVNGFKVRLDPKNILKGEAISLEGKIYVPQAFESMISMKTFNPNPIPEDLASLGDKWVYESTVAKGTNTKKLPTQNINGEQYILASEAARLYGKKLQQTKRGLLLISDKTIQYDENNKLLDDCVITLFDTPEKLADPDIATEYIPTLKRQGKWTDHVKVTREQQKILDGQEASWPLTPASQYNYTGFNHSLLGSPPPPPGTYPRILFSEKDIPMLAKRIENSKVGKMSLIEIEHLLNNSWWDEHTSDGKIFKQLYTGNLQDLHWPDGGPIPNAPPTSIAHQFKDQKPGIYSSHISYVPECLSVMALYCLLTNNNTRGKQAATAIANYFKLREPMIDEWNAASDSEMATSYTRKDGTKAEVAGNGSATTWRNIHGLVAHMNLGLSLDFAGKWMTAEEKDLMRRVIAKATYGRRGYGQDGPIRFRDVNWVTWDLPNFLAVTAIEGLEGFDREAYQANCETVKAFCEWGIDKNGVVYESNGKSPGGFQFQILAMITLARRGENLWGHPHIRKLLEAQILMTSPSGKVIVNSGTQYAPFSQSPLSLQTVNEFKAFFPENLQADYLLSQPTQIGDHNDEANRPWILENFDENSYRSKISSIKRVRMPSPMYPGFVHGLLYDSDFKLTTREELKLPAVFNAPAHGVFSAYSDHSRNGTWINMTVRPNHYLGAGHHHADAGMIHFSALGVDWFTESPFPQVYDGKYHNQVLVDGKSQSENEGSIGTSYQATATYLGSQHDEHGSFASADLTNSYAYSWQTQPPGQWDEKMKAREWEIDPSPDNLKIFAGTSRYKMRPWWPTYTFSNYIATSRALFNPMKFVYRTVGMVRGHHHYSLVVDDLQKDSSTHLYDWTVMLNGGVWEAEASGLANNQIMLGKGPYNPSDSSKSGKLTPVKGDPLLLVTVLSDDHPSTEALISVARQKGPEKPYMAKTNRYDRLSVKTEKVKANYRILLVPVRHGEEMPQITYANEVAKLQWANGQVDEIRFSTVNNMTKLTVERNNKIIIELK
jgi:hypothetical protein